MCKNSETIARFHLPGLFEFYEFYKEFLPIYEKHRNYFFDNSQIASIYGAPADCLWGGGRAGFGAASPAQVFSLMDDYDISSRLTFSNSLLRPEHLQDKRCNSLCKMLSQRDGVIVHSDLLLNYLRETYPYLYFVSSTTKVLTHFHELVDELNKEDFTYVVPDFRLNKCFDDLKDLSQYQKDKVEFLCNECCWFNCRDRKNCYEQVSRLNLGEDNLSHHCKAPDSNLGYSFSRAMTNPGFISRKDIEDTYLPMGFTNFKIEGRSLGSALLLEFILYYMVKPEYHIHIRETLYLSNTLDLF